MVLVLALSMHAIFEGIALGLTKDFSATLNIMLALMCHKVPAAMSLGSSITKNFAEVHEKSFAQALIHPLDLSGCRNKLRARR